MDDKVVISIFVGLEGVHAFSAFLPSVFTIKTFVSDADGIRFIREGEIMAVLFVTAISLVTSRITNSLWPFLFGLGSAALMLAVYEKAVRESRAYGKKGEHLAGATEYDEALMYYNEE